MSHSGFIFLISVAIIPGGVRGDSGYVNVPGYGPVGYGPGMRPASSTIKKPLSKFERGIHSNRPLTTPKCLTN